MIQKAVHIAADFRVDNRQPVGETVPPYWRMDDVGSMVEQIADDARRARHAGKLAIHRVEERHHPSRGEASCQIASVEEPRCYEHQQHANRRDHVRSDSEPRRRAGHVECRPGPCIFGDEIGDPLVDVCVEQLSTALTGSSESECAPSSTRRRSLRTNCSPDGTVTSRPARLRRRVGPGRRQRRAVARMATR